LCVCFVNFYRSTDSNTNATDVQTNTSLTRAWTTMY